MRFAQYLYSRIAEPLNILSILDTLYKEDGSPENDDNNPLDQLKDYISTKGFTETGTLALRSLFKFRKLHEEALSKQIEELKSKDLYEEFKETRLI
jgi:hypothetical protein